jgi:hypothetical protein
MNPRFRLPKPSRRHAIAATVVAGLAVLWFSEFRDLGNPLAVHVVPPMISAAKGQPTIGRKRAAAETPMIRLSVTNSSRTTVTLDVRCRIDTDHQMFETVLSRPVEPVRLDPGGTVECEVAAPPRDQGARVMLYWTTPLQAWVARHCGGLSFRLTPTDWVDLE